MENLKANIVIVDDDPSVGELLSKFLTKKNYTVNWFTSPFQALGHLKDHPVNFLLTDLHMPEMNGVELIKATKEFKPDLPIIVMSGTYDLSLLDELDSLKVSQRIAKPFKLEALEQIIAYNLNPVESLTAVNDKHSRNSNIKLTGQGEVYDKRT
jgi:DNA-binding NtrC family response regulator